MVRHTIGFMLALIGIVIIFISAADLVHFIQHTQSVYIAQAMRLVGSPLPPAPSCMMGMVAGAMLFAGGCMIDGFHDDTDATDFQADASQTTV